MEFPNYCVRFHSKNGWWDNETYYYYTEEEAIDHMKLFEDDYNRAIAKELYEKITVKNDSTEKLIAELKF